MTAMDSVKAKLDEYEYLLKLQMAKIEELSAENARLKADADAHATLRAIYTDPDAPRSDRIKAATASLPHEKPKFGSVLPALSGHVSRRERWRLFEKWSQRREYIIEHHDLPPKGWDQHLQPDTFQEPEGTDLPPVEIVPDPSSPWGTRILTNLLPIPGRRNGNGNDDDSKD
jgi:hypothetical protein